MTKLDDELEREKPLHKNQELAFSVPIPPSVNHMYTTTRGGKKILTKKAKEYVSEVQRIILETIKKTKWKAEPEKVWLYVDLYFYFPDKRIRDSHNCIKILLDCMQGIVFENDYFVMPRVQMVELCREHPCLDVIVFPQQID